MIIRERESKMSLTLSSLLTIRGNDEVLSISPYIYSIYLGRHQLHLLYFSITPPPLPLIISKFYIQRQQQRNSIETQKAAKTSLMQFLFHIFFYFLFFSFSITRITSLKIENMKLNEAKKNKRNDTI